MGEKGLIVGLLIGLQVWAQDQDFYPSPPFSLNAYINKVSVFSSAGNPASLAEMRAGIFGVYSERKYLLPDLNRLNAAIALPSVSGNFGGIINYSGNSAYNEIKAGLAYARKLGTLVDLGMQINYNGIHINGYGKAGILTVQLGSIFHLTENLHSGFQIEWPANKKFGINKEENWPSNYSYGIGYDLSEKFSLALVINKKERREADISAGFQYEPGKKLLIAMGVCSLLKGGWMRIGLKAKSFLIELSSVYHAQLGISPALAISWKFKNDVPD